MENTGKVHFEDDRAQWYIALGDRWVGPMTAADVYERIQSQEISPAHYVWKQGQANWKRVCDVAAFESVVPQQPASKPAIKKAEPRRGPPGEKKGVGAPPPPETGRVWFLYYNETQFGPFSDEEIARFLSIGKIHGRVHAWKDGMSSWARLENLPEFKDAVATARQAKGPKQPKPKPKLEPKLDARSDQRSSPRRPLVAKIVLAHQDSVIVGVCRDISVGGMQVLTDRVPGQAGARIRMNVSPSGADPTVDPFVAEGIIVRILEDGRGFSFRFDKLAENARRSIEHYIT